MLIKEKVEQAKGILKEFDIDCWITFVRESQINGDPVLPFLASADLTWHSAYIFSKTGETHVIVGSYDKKTVEDLGVYDRVSGFVEGLREPFVDYMKKINPAQIAVNFSEGSEICDGITHGMFLTLHDMLNEIGMAERIISAEKIISALRQRKTATELSATKQAIRYTEQIFEEVAEFIRPGKTEKEIADFMKGKVESRGLELAWEETVCPAVFTGPDTAEAHYAPTDRKVKKGHVLNMDFGIRHQGYCSDLQRTFYILENGQHEAPPDVRKGFDTILSSVEESRKAMRPGVQGLEIDQIARDIVVQNGYEAFPHAVGHQVGRFSHDGTALLGPSWEKYAQKPYQKLEAGMVFTLEPCLDVTDRGIVTIEEMVLVTDEGAEYLSTPQRELILI